MQEHNWVPEFVPHIALAQNRARPQSFSQATIDVFHGPMVEFFREFPLGLEGLVDDLQNGICCWLHARCILYHFEKIYGKPNLHGHSRARCWATIVITGDTPSNSAACRLLMEWIAEASCSVSLAA